MKIPKRFADARSNKVKPWFRQFVEDYLEHPDRRAREGEGLIIAGANGSGKTWTSVAIAWGLNQLSHRRLPVVYVNSGEMVERLWPVYRPEEHYIQDWDMTYTEVMCTCGLLILDDFGHEAIVKNGGTKLSRLLRVRMDEKKLTFITTNFSFQARNEDGADTLGRSVSSLVDRLCPWQMETRALDIEANKVRRYRGEVPK